MKHNEQMEAYDLSLSLPGDIPVIVMRAEAVTDTGQWVGCWITSTPTHWEMLKESLAKNLVIVLVNDSRDKGLGEISGDITIEWWHSFISTTEEEE